MYSESETLGIEKNLAGAEALGRERVMPDYKINYEGVGQYTTTPLTHEFAADNDQEARKIYDEFKSGIETQNASGRSSIKHLVFGLRRIDQREISVMIS